MNNGYHRTPTLRRRLFRAGLALVAVLVATLSLTPVLAQDALAARAVQKKAAQAVTVYENQPPVTDKELVGFLEILPRFRAWAKEHKEEAHPVLRNGKADFLYSPQAAEWVRAQGWDPVRFFCVMGRMAAALVIVEEGNDMSGTRPRDMPGVTEEELALARHHLGTMLKAGGNAPPINR